MGAETHISWCRHTFNPWLGCTKITPACDGCYAWAMMDVRYGRVEFGGPGKGVGTRQRTSAANWRLPIAWNKAAAKAGTRPFVFCASLADVFDNAVDPAWRRDLFDLIRATPHLVWLLLTKRPQNIVRMSEEAGGLPSNAALGTTCEDQKRADVNELALVNAASEVNPLFTFISSEPMIGPIRLRHLYPIGEDGVVETPRIDWVITGGETDQGGHKARPTHPDWFRGLRDQCAAAGVPFHHKQNGEWVSGMPPAVERYRWPARADGTIPIVERVGKRVSGRMLDGVTHDAFPTVPSIPGASHVA